MDNRYLTISKRHIIPFILCALIIAAAFAAALGGRNTVETQVDKKLPIYSVGREENDKIIGAPRNYRLRCIKQSQKRPGYTASDSHRCQRSDN